MRFTPFTGPKNPVNHGKNAKVAKSTRVCPPTRSPFMERPELVMNFPTVLIECFIEVAWKAEARPFAEFDPFRVHPNPPQQPPPAPPIKKPTPPYTPPLYQITNPTPRPPNPLTPPQTPSSLGTRPPHKHPTLSPCLPLLCPNLPSAWKRMKRRRGDDEEKKGGEKTECTLKFQDFCPGLRFSSENETFKRE